MGVFGRVTDESTIQFRMSNRSKGPAMWSRNQCDRKIFEQKWRKKLEDNPNIDFWQDMVYEALVEKKKSCRDCHKNGNTHKVKVCCIVQWNIYEWINSSGRKKL